MNWGYSMSNIFTGKASVSGFAKNFSGFGSPDKSKNNYLSRTAKSVFTRTDNITYIGKKLFCLKICLFVFLSVFWNSQKFFS